MQTSSHPVEQRLPKLLLGDDHQLVLDALGSFMKQHFDVATANDSTEFLKAVDEFQPDVAVLDITMPGLDGFSAARKALERQPSLPIVFLTMHPESNYRDRAAQVGAKAFISKRLPAHELLTAIQEVLNGTTLLAPSRDGAVNGPGGASKGDLTARQREVLSLIAQGCSAKEIANHLHISVRTAEFHRAAIMQRLALHSTAQMTRFAIEHCIV